MIGSQSGFFVFLYYIYDIDMVAMQYAPYCQLRLSVGGLICVAGHLQSSRLIEYHEVLIFDHTKILPFAHGISHFKCLALPVTNSRPAVITI